MSCRTLLPVSILVVSALVFAASAGASFKYLKPGTEAADFTLRTLDDQEITPARLRESPPLKILLGARRQIVARLFRPLGREALFPRRI